MISTYVLANIQVLGACVAVLHDAADIFANLARIWQPTKQLWLSFVFFFTMMVIWTWTRLLVLPYILWVLTMQSIPLIRTMEHSDLLVSLMHSLLFFCVCMVMLHFYWFILLSQMLIGYVYKNKSDDLL
jgi:TLC domain